MIEREQRQAAVAHGRCSSGRGRHGVRGARLPLKKTIQVWPCNLQTWLYHKIQIGVNVANQKEHAVKLVL